MRDFLAGISLKRSFVKFEESLSEVDYKGIFETPLWTQDFGDRWSELPSGALALDLGVWRLVEAPRIFKSSEDPLRYLPIDWILGGPALLAPHGLEVLTSPPLPALPTVPNLLASYEEKSTELTAKIESVRRLVAEKVRKDQPNIARAAEIAVSCKQGDLVAIRALMLTMAEAELGTSSAPRSRRRRPDRAAGKMKRPALAVPTRAGRKRE